MFPTAIVLILSAVATFAGSEPVRQASSASMIGRLMPSFYSGYLYAAEPANTVTLFDRNGETVITLAIPGKGNSDVHVMSLAVDSDGTLAIAWRDSSNHGIDIRDSTGTLIRSIDTGLFQPAHLAFGEDHSIWSFGVQLSDAKVHTAQKQDYLTVRKYSLDGRQIGAYLPRSLFPAGLEPCGVGTFQERRITVTSDRVGLEADSGTIGDQREWVELDLNGNVTGRWKLDPAHHFPGVALTSDNRAYIHRRDPDNKAWQVFQLNRDAAKWEKVEATPNIELYGADGDQLVFATWRDDIMHLSWYPQPAAPTTVTQSIQK